jgi:hypothetical protein
VLIVKIIMIHVILAAVVYYFCPVITMLDFVFIGVCCRGWYPPGFVMFYICRYNMYFGKTFVCIFLFRHCSVSFHVPCRLFIDDDIFKDSPICFYICYE